MPTFPYLPGTTVQINDQGLQIAMPPAGPAVLLLGMTTSTNVAATPYTPYSVSNSSISAADQAFRNSDGTISELCEALYEADIAGAQNIYLCNILPTASGSMSVTGNPLGVIAGSVANNDKYGYLAAAYYDLINFPVDIVCPVGVHLDDSVTANYGWPSDGKTSAGTAWNFAWQLANFCYQCTVNNQTTIGVIGVNNAVASGAVPTTQTPTLGSVNTWVNNAANYTGNFACYNGTQATALGVPGNYQFVATSYQNMPANYASGDVLDALGNHVDLGAYISVVAANAAASNVAAYTIFPVQGYYNSTGASTYAGLVASLPSQNAPTNKVLQGITLQQGISEYQANTLAGSRYVTFIQKPKGVVVTSAMTGAYNINQYSRSDYTRLSTVRIVHDAINYIRQVGDPFIGGPNTAPQRNALSTGINTALTSMQTAGALTRFDFTVYASPTDTVLGNAKVQLVLVPAFELQQIVVTVALTSQ